MMKQIITLSLFLAFLSCQEKMACIESVENKNLKPQQIDSIMSRFNFEYESPIVLKKSNQVLIPISAFVDDRTNSSFKSDYSSDKFPRYWNVLFYNRKTDESQLLTEKKVRISQIHINQDIETDSNKTLKNVILYEIIDTDFNSDAKLNDVDPEYLFSSDESGKNLKRISPIHEDLQQFQVIPNSGQLLIKTLRDVNQDSIFNNKDESIWYKAELVNQDWKIKEVIDSEGRKRIENLFFEQWLKKK